MLSESESEFLAEMHAETINVRPGVSADISAPDLARLLTIIRRLESAASPSGVSGMTETPERPELLPCPFCGESATLVKTRGGLFEARCIADACPVQPYVADDSRHQIVAVWNLRASSLGEPVSQEAPADEEIDFSGPTPRPIVFTGCNGDCVAEGGYPALCEMYPDNRHVGCSRQTRVRCCGALTVHAYDCKRDTARPACATCKREIHTSLPVDFCSEECRSAFSGIPRTENEPCTCALAGLDATTHDGHLADCPKYASVISSASPLSEEERQDITEIEGVRDGLRKSAIHKRGAARATPDDYLRNTWNDWADEHDRRADFWQRIIDRLSASAPSPEDKGSERC